MLYLEEKRQALPDNKKAGLFIYLLERRTKVFTTQTKVKAGGQILLIPPDLIYPNPNQPRRDFNMDELHSLADSIRVSGILQPITVRQGENGLYELVAGERRLRAARIAGVPRIPCIEIRVCNDESAVLALIENIQRSNLSYFEEAEGIAQLMAQLGANQDEIARRLGKAQSTLSNKLRLLKLSPELRRQIAEAGLTERHARALLKLEDPKLQKQALHEIISKRLNVSDTDKLVEQMNRPQKKKKGKPMLVLKDIRIFMNTISHAVDTMKRAGIAAVSEKNETDDYIEYHVRIQKTGEVQKTPA